MEKKGLDHSAYGGVSGEDYIPYIPASEAMPEITVVSIIMGVLLAALFAAANTYLGLKVGMTIAAGIPSAVLATGILKGLFKRNNVLEANMIQSIAAMGEALAGGIIFTLPAIIIWGLELKLSTIVVATLLGGLIGIFFVVPLRKYLTVEEHGKLIFPESMAAAEILATGSSGGSGFKTVLTGLLYGGGYKLLSGGFALWMEEPQWTIKSLQSTVFGIDTLASLAGVGFIIGIEAALYMFAGALVAWFGLIPLIKYVGAGLTTPLFPSQTLISQMSASAIWSSYIRYVGAGAVAAGGFISLGRSLPTIIRSFRSAMGGLGKGSASTKRTDVDAPIIWVIGAAVFVFLLAWLLPMISIGPIGSFLVVIFAFFFAVVSARMCGIIGASNNPVSGMTIASLLFITAVLKATGMTGQQGMIAAILAGSIVCIAIAVSGDAAQALKTTHIIGGTPKRVEFSMYAGVVFSSVFSGLVLLMLNHTYGIGSDAVAAPQATLMSMVVKGVMTGQLPWVLVIIGVTFGVMCALMRLPILPVALGLYLPIHLSAGILIGGLVRVLVDYKFRNNSAQQKERVEKGILLSSGLVAGDAIMGIVIALFATLSVNIGFGANILPGITGSPYTATILYVLLAIWMYRVTIKKDGKQNG
ncbi:oligopeptide transporter, OPT family [Desulfosporosinus sp. PR]|uniref:OPT family oligopeptide transporter n=1 Tax=Candidatus Desulfosporosinus nitrosoreducens TaxID=3401928 RepID=UPI0027ECF057|nr:oligopeptide transporter, OPT family [Desulfosporosinus sp. PR]MDQ7094612.1 oligopeptide transporter, OPT family [Desulfosporosinus sp. PR]